MRTSAILTLGALSLAQAELPSAPVIKDNTPGKAYVANLAPKYGAPYPISGSVQVVASEDGVGADYTISVEGFDSSKGPFAYHIHNFPVAADGNCSSTGAHLDPTLRGEDPKCDAENPAQCQVGDLAGKYGKIKGDQYLANYHDDYTSTTAGNPAFFGNRSITFHLPDKTRIACANFELVKGGAEPPSSTGVVPKPSGGAPYPIGSSDKPCASGTAVSSGYAAPSGTGAGPYPTGGAPGGSPSGQPGSGGNGGNGGNGGSGAVPPSPSATNTVPGNGDNVSTGAAASVKASFFGAAAIAGFVALFV